MLPEEILTEKTCKRCLQTKLLELFASANKKKFSSTICKKCKSQLTVEWRRTKPHLGRAAHKRWKKAHPEHMNRLKRNAYHRDNPGGKSLAQVVAEKEAKALRTEKPCKRCGITKSMDQYHLAKNTADGRTYQCRACIAARVRLWYAKDPTSKIADAKRYQARHPEAQKHQNHKRRARKKNAAGSHTLKEWIALCASFENRCVRCGSVEKMTRDHIAPLTKGGTNNIENIQPLCLSCNVKKGNRLIVDYRATPFKSLS